MKSGGFLNNIPWQKIPLPTPIPPYLPAYPVQHFLQPFPACINIINIFANLQRFFPVMRIDNLTLVQVNSYGYAITERFISKHFLQCPSPPSPAGSRYFLTIPSTPSFPAHMISVVMSFSTSPCISSPVMPER